MIAFAEECSIQLTRKRSISGREADVVHPGHGNESPAGGRIVGRARRELREHDSGDREEQAVGQVSADHRPSATNLVDEQNAAHLGNQCQHGGNTLVLERVVGADADLREDGRRVVLDRADTSHLNTSLDGTDEYESAEGRLVLEQLSVGLCGVFVFVCNGVLDLVELGAYPGVVFVAMSVESGERRQSFAGLSVVDEPSDVCQYIAAHHKCQSAYLGDSGKSMIKRARTPAGMIWIPKLRRHCIALSSGKFLFVPKVVQDATSAPIPNMNC